MKKIVRLLLITLTVLLSAGIAVLIATALWLRTDSARQMIFQNAIGILEEKLQTKVKADSIGIELLRGQVRVYGLMINDREDSLLLSVKKVHAGIAPDDLLDGTVRITDVELIDANARLWRDSTNSNYQFVIDAFKKKHTTKKKEKKSSKMKLVVDVNDVNIRNLRVKWDRRDKIRKNILNPHRGAFDANHIDAVLSMSTSVKQSSTGVYNIHLNDIKARDNASGLHVDDLKVEADVSKERIAVHGVSLGMDSTRVDMQPFVIDLKQKRMVAPFEVKAYVLLKNLAQPFAPVLSNFTTPLLLTTKVSGPLRCLRVDDINVWTPDNRLHLTANGTLDGAFGRKYGLNLKFRDIDMTATHNIKDQIVMHFAKKTRLKMMRQMRAIGDIRFQGTLDVQYKRETIAGKLTTPHGYLTTRFVINDSTHYMKGYLHTPSMDMGKIMNINNLGAVRCKADFNINISKKTPRPATALPNGRLPMGTAFIHVQDASYDRFVFPDLNIKLDCDGSTAKGMLRGSAENRNISADVRYVQTDKQQSVWFQLTPQAQQWLLKEGVEMLEEKLHSKVEADKLDLRFFDGMAKIYGVRVMDQKNAPLLSLDTLSVLLDAHELLKNKVHVTHIGLYGMKAQLNKDSIFSNFQFVIDAFTKGKHIKKIPRIHNGKKTKKQMFQLVVDLKEIKIEDMRLKWDVKDKPHKNQAYPHKGAFDTNHADVELNMRAAFRQTADGSYEITIRQMDLTENNSELVFDNIRARAFFNKDVVRLEDLFFQMPNTWIEVEPLRMNIKSRTLLTPLTFRSHVVLQDIATPFAPVLRNFTTPLDIKAVVSGSLNNLHVDEMQLNTNDERFMLNAKGLINGIAASKNSLNLKFNDLTLNVDNETLMKLVMHFNNTVRLKMMNQLAKIGNVHFDGDVDVTNRNETFKGKLNTEFGNVETNFTLDNQTHFMNGWVDAKAFLIGRFLNIKPLGGIDCHIDFTFNTSRKSPRPATALPNGRLPQGKVSAIVNNVKFSIFHAKRIEANVTSDGSTATGSVTIPRIVSDFIINFNYVQTDDEQHLKVRPKYRFHNLFRRNKAKNRQSPQ